MHDVCQLCTSTATDRESSHEMNSGPDMSNKVTCDQVTFIRLQIGMNEVCIGVAKANLFQNGYSYKGMNSTASWK